MKNWYIATKSDASQGQVADEETGQTVAVVYDPKDVALIAAAPKLQAALNRLLAGCEDINSGFSQAATLAGLENCEALAEARCALREAKGE